MVVIMFQYSLGIDIGGTFIKYGLVDKNYNIIEKWKVPTTKFNTKDELYDYICSNCRELDEVHNIGVCAPGLIYKDSDVKSYGSDNVRVMYGTNVNKEISQRTGRKVLTINDAKAAGLCELKIGNAKDTQSSAFLIIGTGLGGCICNRENVIYGENCFAGEFHYLPLIDFRNKSVKRLGDYCSITGLINIYNDKLDVKDKAENGRDIFQRYLKRDKAGNAAIDEWTNNIAVAMLTLAVFYNPEIICIGGGISEEEWLIDILQDKFANTINEYFEGAKPISTKIKKCRYNNDANIIGAVLNTEL